VTHTITEHKHNEKYVEGYKTSCAAPCVHSATNLFSKCTERIYNKILKLQVSAYVKIMLFMMFEFNRQEMNQSFTLPPFRHTFGHMVYITMGHKKMDTPAMQHITTKLRFSYHLLCNWCKTINT